MCSVGAAPWPRGNRQRHAAPSPEVGLGGGCSGQALGHRITTKPQALHPTTRPHGANESGPFFFALTCHHAPSPPHFSMSLQGEQMTPHPTWGLRFLNQKRKRDKEKVVPATL